jgi:hypothetical protein
VIRIYKENHMNRRRVAIAFLSSIFVFVSSVYAAVSIAPDFQGTLVINSPSGEISVLEPGDAAPDIVNGSVLQLLQGHITVATEAGDSVHLGFCQGNTAGLTDGASASLTCEGKACVVKAIKGQIVLVGPDKNKSDLLEGAQQTLECLNENEAPPTAEGDPLGTPIDSASPVDSRSIEASPSA